ncbi:GNAT family N-acetyltransferase [Sporolactobacillus laevolacticus]|uniref:GNAT family N-acetyltransferase n=1 Tax=Sporolactobacillus laevolacticus TaxID=33018 RepID=UPI00338DA950
MHSSILSACLWGHLKKTNTLIGHVGLSKISDGVEIGYAIGMDYQGNGYATESVGAFSIWAKNTTSFLMEKNS